MNSGQRLIGALLHEYGGPMQRTVLMKLLFLLSRETPLRGDSFPYAFVPYHFGPFSFKAYRDLGKLIDSGFVAEGDGGVEPTHQLRDTAIPADHLAALSWIVERYGSVKRINLLRYTYPKYPWYTALSTLEDRVAHRLQDLPVAAPAVHTIGYGGRDIDQFLNLLLKSGLRGVCDVRAVPASRSYGFHRKTLSDLLHKLGLQYHPFPQLGIPTKLRRAYLGDGGAGLAALLAHYRNWLPGAEAAVIDQLAGAITHTPLALLCVEADPADCHRGVLAQTLAQTTDLPVIHI